MRTRNWALMIVVGLIGCKAEVAPFDFENLGPIELTEFDTAPSPVPPDTPVGPVAPEPPEELALDSLADRSCPVGSIQLPGLDDCVAIGWTCPEGLWATAGTSAGDVYVSPEGTGDGSGSSSPLGSIQAALDIAPDGATVWLSRGVYEESLVISRGVTLQGVCVSDTTIRAVDESGIRIESAEHVMVRGLTVREGSQGILIEPEATSVDLDSVRIIHAQNAGLGVRAGEQSLALDLDYLDIESAEINRGQVTLNNSSVTPVTGSAELALAGTTQLSGDTIFVGSGDLSVSEQADVSLFNLVISEGGFSVSGADARMSIEQGFLAQQESSGAESDSMRINGGSVNLISVGIVEGSGAGLLVVGEEASLYGRDLEVQQRTTAGRGLEVSGGAYASVDRMAVIVGGADALGISVSGQNTEFNGRSVSVFSSSDSPMLQSGIVVEDSAWATLERAQLDGGIKLDSDFVDVDATDLRITNAPGLGVDIQGGASLTLERAHIEGSTQTGIRVSGAGTDLRAQDLVVLATREAADGGGGYGLQVSDGSKAVLERTRFEANHTAGIVASGAGVKVTVSDLSVVGTLSRSDGLYGGGLYVGNGVDLQMVRVNLQQNRDVGVSATGVDTKLFASSLVAQQTSDLECAADTGCSKSGVGLFCEDASCLVGEFELVDNALCGMVLVAKDGQPSWGTDWFMAQSGLITRNAVGIDIQIEDFNPNVSLSEVFNFGNTEADFSGRTIELGAQPEVYLPESAQRN